MTQGTLCLLQLHKPSGASPCRAAENFAVLLPKLRVAALAWVFMQKHVVKPNFLLRVVERLYQGAIPIVIRWFCSFALHLACCILHFLVSSA